jgi:hypothetical protein
MFANMKGGILEKAIAGVKVSAVIFHQSVKGGNDEN